MFIKLDPNISSDTNFYFFSMLSDRFQPLNNLAEKLIQKQGQVFVLSFTNVWLSTKNPKIIPLGPKPEIAAQFDDKIEHIKTFKKLNLSVNKTEIYDNFDDLKNKRKTYPFF